MPPFDTSIIPYAGWQNCLRIRTGHIEAIVTLEVGPRIIRFGFPDGPNAFVEYPDQVGTNGGGTYRSYGGHRLWVAPETSGWTNHPDNGPVVVETSRHSASFTAEREAGTGLRKRIIIESVPHSSGLRVHHRVTNEGTASVTLAPWALSVMAPGGTAFVPQEPFIPHSTKVLPARPTVLWNYTDMTDPRWTWGRRFIRLRQSVEAATPQKVGVCCTDGWAAYVNQGLIFLKRFPWREGISYPDLGCNAEFFTNKKMLEVESLGPLVTLAPGDHVDHDEGWYLYSDGPPPDDEDTTAEFFSRLLAQTSPLP